MFLIKDVYLTSIIVVLLLSLLLMLLLLHEGRSLFALTLTHDYPYNARILHLITMLVSVLRQSEEILLDLVYDLPTHYQIVYVRNLIHLFENVRNFVRNCPKSIITSSENLCPKIKCPKILEINVTTLISKLQTRCISAHDQIYIFHRPLIAVKSTPRVLTICVLQPLCQKVGLFNCNSRMMQSSNLIRGCRIRNFSCIWWTKLA